MRVRLQPLTRARIATLGAAGTAWVDELPRALSELAERWDLSLGRSLPGGSASYAVRAQTRDGARRVLKLLIPDPELADEERVLAAAGGQGYALLHDHDPGRRALLLESLGRSLEQSPLGPETKLVALVDTLGVAWRVPPTTAPEPAPGQDKASTLRRMVLELDARLDRPTHRGVLAQALEYAERRAAALDPASSVVVHGDPHPGNLLRVEEPRAGAASGWVLIDPDGFRCDPAYDLGVVLRDWTGQLGGDARGVLGGYCDLVADRSGLERQAIWEWGFLERVSTGLFVMSFGAERVGRRFLDSAEGLI